MGTLEAENKAFEDLKHKHIAMGSALLERRPFFHYSYTHTYTIFSTSLRHLLNILTPSSQHPYAIFSTSLRHLLNILTIILPLFLRQSFRPSAFRARRVRDELEVIY
jgi:hypothetical protein